MSDQNPTTLIMLLSMAKLQQGQMLVGGYDKRWQTPEEVYAQTHEAVTHLQTTGRAVDKVVLLYTDNLYLNNDGPAIKLLEKYQDQTIHHRKETQKLFARDEIKLPVVEMLWNELVQGQNDYQSPRVKLKQFYQNNASFRAAVQHDNPKRSEADGSLTAADMFVLEETGLFDGLAKGQIASNKINSDHDLVIAYPGPTLQSLEAVQQQHLQIYKSRPLRALDKPNATSWLDLSVKDQPVEKEIYRHIPHPNALKNKGTETKKKQSFSLPRPLKVAASFILPVVAAATWFVTKPKVEPKTPEPMIYENDYSAAVEWHTGPMPEQKTVLVFRKDSANQKPQDWSAVRVQYGEQPPGRPLMFRDDVGYINGAMQILAEKKQFKFEAL